MQSNLPPIDFKEDIEKHEAFQEVKTVKIPKCSHKTARIIGQELRCVCGATYTGSNLQQLQKLFMNQ